MKTKDEKVERISVKGLKVGNLPRGNPTLKISKKVDPETLPVRCQKPYERIQDKGEVPIEDVVKGNRHVRWSVRLLIGAPLKCVEAIPEPEAEKVKAKPKVKKATPRKPRRKAEGPKPETPAPEV